MTNVLQGIPVTKMKPGDQLSSLVETENTKVSRVLRFISREMKGHAYSSFLGFYKNNATGLTDKKLVTFANKYAACMEALDEDNLPPPLTQSFVANTKLKYTKGLNIVEKLRKNTYRKFN